ncbi:FAD-binding oxidoreductase [Amycolatopsis pithecellobii]|uniref:FAD-binding protein n=1 Tax=Amycolatopsis pithecellobii TaxID=664692 RepID=A0A6N7YVW6_9PSEU|nr:FAD-binding oxidoreductase [Amycolatopsis pithecellobii]MTD52469.1 FAD-binding protein [Amycolatopsis pithecellobii]
MVHDTREAKSGVVSSLRLALGANALITPEDPRYERARRVFSGGYDRHPVVIALPGDAGEVAKVVSIVQEAGVELAIRGGGHSPAGYGVVDGGVVLDLSRLRDLEIDVDQRTAWAQTGLTAGEYTNATARHGLATGFGDTASVGIGGATLAGGLGLLSRKYGLTVDDLLAAEIVTADGQLQRVDDASHPDLFWALKGGGGNFGVVTRFKYRLRDVSQFTGGVLVHAATPDIVTKFIAAADAAPDELSTVVMVMSAPPLPFLPADVHGKPILLATLAYNGPSESAERAIAPLRAVAAPLADLVGPKPYQQLLAPEDENRPIAAHRNMFLDSLDEEAAARIVAAVGTSSAQVPAVQFRIMGGAVARVPADATAFAHRHRRMMVNVIAIYEDASQATAHEAWVATLADSLRPGPGVYTGFLGEEGGGLMHEAYPDATWDRLVSIKGKYDPGNLFHHNHNVPPE